MKLKALAQLTSGNHSRDLSDTVLEACATRESERLAKD